MQPIKIVFLAHVLSQLIIYFVMDDATLVYALLDTSSIQLQVVH